MLLKVATIIQACIDKRTMDNKDFKTKLDDLYNDLVMPTSKYKYFKHSLVAKSRRRYNNIDRPFVHRRRILLLPCYQRQFKLMNGQ